MARWSALNQIYKIYTSDLSWKEIETTIKREVPQVYDFYANNVTKPNPADNSLRKTIIFLKGLLIEFLLKLSPVRRLFYTAAVVFFIMGYMSNQWNWVFFGFLMLNVLIVFELADKLTAKDELAVAREIQNSLIPQKEINHPMFEISFYSEPAKEVGGDYFDYVASGINEDKKFMVIGDVSGKGMKAAIHMVQMQALLRHLIKTLCNSKEILISLNKILHGILRSSDFVTASIVELNNDRILKVCRAGHTPVIHYRCNYNQCFKVTPKGMALGLKNNGTFDSVLEETEIVTEPGDVLVLFTDGVTEAANSYMQLYGEENLIKMIEKNSGKSASAIQDCILNSIIEFRRENSLCDDLTLAVLKAV